MSLKGVSGVIDYRLMAELSAKLKANNVSEETLQATLEEYMKKCHEIYQRLEAREISYKKMRALQKQMAKKLLAGTKKKRFSLFK